MTMNGKQDLTVGNAGITIDNEGVTESSSEGEVPSSAEDTPNAYVDLLAQKDNVIAALQEQNRMLAEQAKTANDNWADAIRKGAALVSDGNGVKPQAQHPQVDDDYVYLRDMDFTFTGKEDFK